MANKRARATVPKATKPGARKEARVPAASVILALAARKGAKRDAGALLALLVSGLRLGTLTPAEAGVIAVWLERIAAGEDARDVFWQRDGGRPSNRNRDLDIAWIVRDRIADKVPPGIVHAQVAVAFGLSSRTVANICAKVTKELTPR